MLKVWRLQRVVKVWYWVEGRFRIFKERLGEGIGEILILSVIFLVLKGLWRGVDVWYDVVGLDYLKNEYDGLWVQIQFSCSGDQKVKDVSVVRL